MPCINYTLPMHLFAAFPLFITSYYSLSDKSRILPCFHSIYIYLYLQCTPVVLTHTGVLFSPQWSWAGTGALWETTAIQPQKIQFFPLRPGALWQTGTASGDRKDSFCGLCGKGESKRHSGIQLWIFTLKLPQLDLWKHVRHKTLLMDIFHMQRKTKQNKKIHMHYTHYCQELLSSKIEDTSEIVAG